MTKQEQKKICEICGGSGQLSFFKGASRFLLSTEECAECAGTGMQLGSPAGQEAPAQKGNKKKGGSEDGRK